MMSGGNEERVRHPEGTVPAANGLPGSNDPPLGPDQMIPLVRVTPCFLPGGMAAVQPSE